MKIESPRFGTLEVDPDKIIEFPRGLPGFEDCRRFSLFNPQGDDPKYFILQSLDDPAVAFHIADPGRFGFSFEISLSDEEAAELQMTDPADAAVVVLLSKHDDKSPVTANLNAPLVINLAARRGLQHVFSRLDYQTQQSGK
ncbi:MAG: flagellar assembly protein FliW [Ignavibacteria bacterium]